MSEVRIVGIVGSLRTNSINRSIARAAMGAPIDGADLSLHDIADVPLYNGDVEDAGLPVAVQELNAAVSASSGLILFSPEYNSSFPAVTKNVFDWLTRPPTAWENVAIAMITASPGGRAGLGVREHFAAIIGRQPVRYFDTLGIGSCGDKLGDSGELTDDATREELHSFVERFAAFCADD